MHAYQGNLCVPDDPNPAAFTSPEFSNFDVAAVGLGFHHFDDPTLAARRLAERLKTGGVLMILDFLPHDKPDVSLLSPPTTKSVRRMDDGRLTRAVLVP
jgi:SAM-dependent methyltransferase